MATLFNTKIKDTYQSLLKLEDNTILTTTSKNITDGLGNASPLYLSTTQVRIGSNSGSALYWDDTNNRLGIGTSSPTQSIETPNAIVFASANNDSKTTLKAFDAATGNIDFTNEFIISRQGTNLVKMFFNNTIGIGGIGSAAKLGVRGSGSTSATTSLLVQNSAGTTGLAVLDNGNINLNGTLLNNSYNTGIIYINNNGQGNISLSALNSQLNYTGNFKFGGPNNNTTSAVVQIDSTTKGFLPPRMTTVQRDAIASPATGLQVFNTTLGTLDIYDGTGWNRFGQQTLIKGSGSTSSTTPLLVQNSSAFQLLKVTDDGQCLIGGDGLTTFPLQVYGNSGLQIQVGNTFFSYNAVRTIRFLNSNNGIPLNHEIVNQVSNTDNSNYVYFRNQGTQTAGSNPEWKGISIETIVQTQSSAVATQLSITPTLDLNPNTISSAIQRGIYYNPTITNLRVATHRALELTSGDLVWGSGYAPYLGNANEGFIQFSTAGQYGSRISLRPSGNQGGFGTNSYVSYIENTGYSFVVKGGNYQTTYLGGDSIVFTDGNLNERARIAISTGNLLVGTTSDLAKLTVRGSGSTSATTALLVQDSGSSQLFKIADSGWTTINSRLYLLGDTIYNSSSQPALGVGGTMYMQSNTGIDFSWQNLVQGRFSFGTNVNTNNSVGSPKNSLYTSHTINDGAASSLTEFRSMAVLDTMNMTTFPLTTFIGLFISPTIVSSTTKVRAIQSTIGGAYFNTSSVNASAVLQADSTTQGFLPPRVTTIQKNAIATPAEGLMVYDTDLKRPCFFNGTSWITL